MKDEPYRHGREAPIRECQNGCGRTRKQWSEWFVCKTCQGDPLARARGPESLRALRQRLRESATHDA